MPGANDQIVRFAYASRVVKGATDKDLLAIVQRSWQYNLVNKVNGLLELRSGRFQQMIEAPRLVMVSLIPRILSDARHTSIDITAIEDVGARSFDNWSVQGFEACGFVAPEDTQPVPVTDSHGNVVFTDVFHRNGARPSPRPKVPKITKPSTDT